jgi:hypothetical protein
MARAAHEIPTHLHVEDRPFWGLTAHQLAVLLAGLVASYGLWLQWPALPMALRAGLAATGALLTLAVALLRPGGRRLEEWAMAALRYLARPRVACWRVSELGAAPMRGEEGGWRPWTPRSTWAVVPDGQAEEGQA